MQLEPWHIPLLVMAGIIVVEGLAVPALRRWAGVVARRVLRTASLGLLAALLVAALVVTALGPSLADQLASVAAAIAGVAALWLAYRSHRPAEAPATGTAPAEVPSGAAAPAEAPPATGRD